MEGRIRDGVQSTCVCGVLGWNKLDLGFDSNYSKENFEGAYSPCSNIVLCPAYLKLHVSTPKNLWLKTIILRHPHQTSIRSLFSIWKFHLPPTNSQKKHQKFTDFTFTTDFLGCWCVHLNPFFPVFPINLSSISQQNSPFRDLGMLPPKTLKPPGFVRWFYRLNSVPWPPPWVVGVVPEWRKISCGWNLLELGRYLVPMVILWSWPVIWMGTSWWLRNLDNNHPGCNKPRK